jgi:predicted amidophosphoribosyltransferase
VISQYLNSIWLGLESLAFDNSCIICRARDSELCIRCREDWRSSPQRISGENFPVFASIPYGETAKAIVLSAKENGVKFTRNLLVTEIYAAIKELVRVFGSMEEINLVPIPSSRRARTRRGFDFISQVTTILAKKLNAEMESIRFMSCPILSIAKSVADQSGLSEIQRRENLFGAFEVTKSLNSTAPIIIIDDVITTGSTLREAVRALKERNLTVLGAATACASQRRLLIR